MTDFLCPKCSTELTPEPTALPAVPEVPDQKTDTDRCHRQLAPAALRPSA